MTNTTKKIQSGYESIKSEAENELVKVLKKANQAIKDKEYLISGKVPDIYDVEYIPPFNELGQRAGYYNIHWALEVDLRVYCHNIEGYGVDVREIDLVFTKYSGARHILDLQKIWRTDLVFTGFNALYAFCGGLIAEYLDTQQAKEYENS